MSDLTQDELRRELAALREENRALKDELARRHSAFQKGLDCVCFMDATGRILSVNPTFSKTIKLPAAEICGQDFADLCPETERDRVRTVLARVSTLNQAERIEIQLRALTDEGRVHELSATPANSIAGEPEILGIAHDVTSYKRLEEDLQARNRQLEVLQQLGLELTSELDRETLLQTIVSQAGELLEGIFCVLGLRHPDSEELRPVAHIGAVLPPKYIRRGEGLAGQVWERGAPIRVDNYQTWEGRLSGKDEGEFSTTLIGVPINWGEEFLGVLEVGRAATRPFIAADVTLLEIFASLAAVALHNAQILQAERAQHQTIEVLTEAALIVSSTLDLEELLDRMLAQVARVVPGDAFNIALITPSGQIRVARARGYAAFGSAAYVTTFSLPLSESFFCQKMVATKEPVLIPDILTEPRWTKLSTQFWLRSYLSAPICVEDEVIGFLNVDGARKDQFSAQDVQRLQIFANHAATALEHARLYQVAREERQALAALTQASLAVNSTLEFEQVLDLILEQVAQVVTGDAYNIMQLEADMSSIVRWKGYERFGAAGFVSTATFSVKETANYQQMLKTGQPLVIHDTLTYPGWIEIPVQSWLRSYVGAPIRIGEKTVGFLNVDSAHPGHFDAEDARRLQSFANQVAATIAHAQLFGELQQRVAELETLQHTMLQLTSSLKLSDVLHELVKSALALTVADDVHIYLYDAEQEQFTFGTALWRDGSCRPAVKTPHPAGLTARVARRGTPIIINDVPQHPWYLAKETWGLEAIAGFPLSWRRKVLGVFSIAFLKPHTFTAAEERLLRLLTDQAAIAVANAQLHQQLQAHAAELEARVAERTAELRAQYARREAIFKSTSDGLVLTNSAGAIIEANPVAQGWLEQTLVPQESERLRETIQQLVRRAAPQPEELLELAGLDLQLTAAAIAAGPPGTAVVNIHDVTHLNALNRARAQFITNVSHGLRTPITIIKLYAQMLPAAPPEKLPEYFAILINEADQQAELVKNILQISSLESGRMLVEPEPTALNSLVAEVLEKYRRWAAKKQLELTYWPAESPPSVLVDPLSFKMVVRNLFHNAIHYTSAAGQITITTGFGEREGRQWATVSVQDTGIGIPPEELPHIFERFYRGATPRQEQLSGIGLGLAIAKGIMDLHGGLITVTSAVGQGATFILWVPLVAGAG